MSMKRFTGTMGVDNTLKGTGGDDILEGLSGHNILTGRGGDDVFIVNYGETSWRKATWVTDFRQYSDDLYYGHHPLWYRRLDTDDDGVVDSTVLYNDARATSRSDARTVVAVLKGFTDTLRLDDFQRGWDAGGRPTSLTAAAVDRAFLGTAGDDVLVGDDGNNWMSGGAGHDILTGGDGADVFVVNYGETSWRQANWVTDFKQGYDKLYYGRHPLWYQQIDTTGDGVPDSTAVYNDALGRSRDDVRSVVAVLKDFTGALTTDDFLAGDGRPTGLEPIRQDFTGTPGNDVLTGNDGNNILIGKGGADILDGGEGTDTASWAGSPNGVTVSLDPDLSGYDGRPKRGTEKGDLILDPNTGRYVFYEGGDSISRPVPNGIFADAQGDRLKNIENLTGTDYGDELYGDGGANVIDGGGGNDHLVGYGGDDRLVGGAGEDMLLGGADSDTLLGGVGKDTLYGDTGDDVLDGGAGNDTLDGGDGRNIMTGGEGTDIFHIHYIDVVISLSKASHITDFSRSELLYIEGGVFRHVWYRREDADGDGDTDTVVYADADRKGVYVVLDDYTDALTSREIFSGIDQTTVSEIL